MQLCQQFKQAFFLIRAILCEEEMQQVYAIFGKKLFEQCDFFFFFFYYINQVNATEPSAHLVQLTYAAQS